MENFNVNNSSSKPTFEQRLAEYFNMPVKTEDSSGSSELSAMNRGTSVSAGKPSLRDRMAEIGKKISEAHKNRKMKFRKWYMKSKLEKLEKKYKKKYEYANTKKLNAVGNKYLHEVAEEVRENFSASLYVQRPDLADIAEGKWLDFKARIDEAYNAVNKEIDTSGEVKFEGELNLPPPEWEKEFDDPNYNPLYDDRHNDYDLFNEDLFSNDDEEGF